MMTKVDWPRATVICVLAMVVGGLQYTGKLPPQWAAGVGTLVVLIAGALRSFVVGALPKEESK